MKENEVLKTVEELNDLLWSKDRNHDHCFIYTNYGVTEAISARILSDNYTISIDLWDDQNSERFYNEVTDEYEPLSDTVLRAFNDARAKLNEINLDLNE